MTDLPTDDRQRAEFRAFVRAHHPDLGGDPEVFAAGVARFRARERGWLHPDGVGPDAAHPDERGRGDARFDAPVEVVGTLPFPVRVGVALIRTWHRRHHPRVE